MMKSSQMTVRQTCLSRAGTPVTLKAMVEKGVCSYLLTCCAKPEDGIILFVSVSLFCFDLAWPSLHCTQSCSYPSERSTGFYIIFHQQKHGPYLSVRNSYEGDSFSVSLLALTVLQ